MRISDWSSDVCSSDLPCFSISRLRSIGRPGAGVFAVGAADARGAAAKSSALADTAAGLPGTAYRGANAAVGDRQSVAEGKRVSVRVGLGGSRNSKKKKKPPSEHQTDHVIHNQS